MAGVAAVEAPSEAALAGGLQQLDSALAALRHARHQRAGSGANGWPEAPPPAPTQPEKAAQLVAAYAAPLDKVCTSLNFVAPYVFIS